jgi:hypothetical protein
MCGDFATTTANRHQAIIVTTDVMQYNSVRTKSVQAALQTGITT